ncbi:MAG: VOC family protein [Myxococcaceae bacterium]|jgi:catechol 2,3-dioxygenase-like lactoylglutathione lyase family enzyme|nr:VOC family protein [Myxococcaceae bacterium]
MIDHLSTYTVDFERAQTFYDRALGALGYQRTAGMVATWDAEFLNRRMAAYGPDGKRVLWLIEVKEKPTPRHVAFVAPSRKHVSAFFEAALAAGGIDNGGPGVREQYHPTYFGAFVLDPDGNNVEAVFYGKE